MGERRHDGRRKGDRQATRERIDLQRRILELTTIDALKERLPPTFAGACSRARLGEARLALGFDGYLVLLRDPQGDRLQIAAADGIRSESASELALAISDAQPKLPLTPIRYLDLATDSAPLVLRGVNARGSLGLFPLTAGGKANGYLVIISNRKNGIEEEVFSALGLTAERLGPAVGAANDMHAESATVPDILTSKSELMSALQRELSRAKRDGTELGVLAVHGDMSNALEEVGPAASLVLLDRLTDRLRQLVRGSDIVARRGGGRFVALLSNCNIDATAQIAEKLLSTSGGTTAANAAGPRISVGIAAEGGDADPEELLRTAETHLQSAIAAGGNRLVRG